MWIKWLLLGILGWLILGFAAFVIMVKVDGDTEVDKEIKQLFGWCLLSGGFSFVVTLCFLIVNLYLYSGISDKFLSWLLKVVNGEEENE